MSYTEIFREFYFLFQFLFASKSGIWKIRKLRKQRDPSTIQIEVIIILN